LILAFDNAKKAAIRIK